MCKRGFSANTTDVFKSEVETSEKVKSFERVFRLLKRQVIVVGASLQSQTLVERLSADPPSDGYPQIAIHEWRTVIEPYQDCAKVYQSDFLCKALVDSIVRILVSVKLTILVALVPTCLFITTKKRIAMTLTSRFRKGYNVLGVFYGHPGVFVNSSHRAIALAREEGFKAKMLAGVSAEDCLFADLEFDPAILGCMTCEASECLTRDRPFNPFIHNIIWQVGSIGIANMTFNNDKFSILVDFAYYVGRVLPQAVSKIETFTVADLRKAEVQSHFDVASTLYVPPRDTGPVDPDHVVPEGHRILQGSPAMKTFLMDLALKPRLLEEYRENPAAVVDRVDGLTEDEKYGLELGTEGPVYALMSRTAEDVSSGKKLSRSDLLGGKPTAFVGLVVILAVVV
ncbi:uroporphyrin-iii c tetrapyrrole (corrin porphyrin) methyltransferase [Moniliophthora roreri MCA 2997]|uniref:Uroporphyrin-iii c tetrapyrrole (Corrin porphyrin) methyltransferase n=1 Tax=Moniliophthora roreri (strain MCA 2997) TaxID=1381753 RepID=V2WR58_MONRO|nr:uroporphyrin-iii c tetrapyrrole (corrin porphyrin) methyltransferase [Moniliophthora roreri MCA 2997]